MESMGRSPGVAAPSRLSSRPRSWSCASAGTAQQGRSKDFDLTETAVREWVKQAERDAGARQDGGLTSAERRELAELRRENRLNGPPRCRRSRPEPDIAKYDSRCTPRV